MFFTYVMPAYVFNICDVMNVISLCVVYIFDVRTLFYDMVATYLLSVVSFYNELLT